MRSKALRAGVRWCSRMRATTKWQEPSLSHPEGYRLAGSRDTGLACPRYNRDRCRSRLRGQRAPRAEPKPGRSIRSTADFQAAPASTIPVGQCERARRIQQPDISANRRCSPTNLWGQLIPPLSSPFTKLRDTRARMIRRATNRHGLRADPEN